MNTLFFFMQDLFQQPLWVPLWVFLLMGINIGSLLFWEKKKAKIIFTTFVLSIGFIVGLYVKFGYEKILGAGHILWIPLGLYLLVRLKEEKGAFQFYLVTFLIAIGISLIMDIAGVLSYFL